MAGSSGSVAALAEVLVRVEIGHVVSSPSMVSRAFLVDHCAAVVVDAGERGYWLVSALSALVPDPEELRVRAAEKGGIPVEHGNPRLVKMTLGWAENSVELKNPVVAAGSLGAGAVPLAIPASLSDQIRSGAGPRPLSLDGDADLQFGDLLAVVAEGGVDPTVRWARVSSDVGFKQNTGAVALDVGLVAAQAGLPVFAIGNGEPSFCGLAVPSDATTSVLLPINALAEAIPAAS